MRPQILFDEDHARGARLCGEANAPTDTFIAAGDAEAGKRHINPTRVPIEAKESICWLENMRSATALLGEAGRLVHVGDRENDLYEFFCAAHDAGTHFLVRTCVDRLAGDGSHTVAAEMAEVVVAGHHLVEIGDGTTAHVALRYKGTVRISVWGRA